MNRPLLLVFALLLNLAAFAQKKLYATEEVFFTNEDIKLSGLVFKPLQPLQPTIGIALIQGSGNSDRTNQWTYAFAEFLANEGIFVLLPDKRGCGKSEGDWKKASFQDLAKDAVASAAFLLRTTNVAKVGVMGLSQGGYIAPLAQTLSSKISFVIDVSGAAVPLEEQIIHEVMNTSREAGLQPEELQEVLKLHVLMRNYVMDGNWQPLEDKFNELKNSRWKTYAATFPSEKNLWVWDWIRLNFDYDPLPYWQKIETPIFIAYGSEDERDNVPVWNSIYRLEKSFSDKKNLKIKVYKTGHALYEDDRAEIRKEFINDLFQWLKTEVNR